MKKTFFLLLFIFAQVTQAQNYNACAYCQMALHQEEFVSEISTSEGETIRFGSIECLLNYLVEKNSSENKNIRVSDYLHPQNKISAEEATYLKSDKIHSPMGANLAAFHSEAEAKDFSSGKNDKIYTWQEIYDLYQSKNSGSGAVHYHDHFRPDAFAPNGVMGDHLHPKGEWMFSLRYMEMQMGGLKKGTGAITTTEAFQNYMIVPQSMQMQMLMLGVMYAPSARLTLALMQSYIYNSMDMDFNAMILANATQMQNNFSTRARGIGDLELSALYGLYSKNEKYLHLNLGLALPIGNIQKRDDTPMGNGTKLPYAMQPGTGTVNTTAGFTYKEMYTNTSWGTQFLATFPLGENSEGYRWGDLYQLNLWGAYRASDNFSFSGRLLGLVQNDIHGRDSELNAMMAPTANPSNYGGEKIKAFGGMNISFPATSSMRNWRLAAEVGAPVYENYNGIQMDENLSFSAGVKYLIL